MTMAQNPSPENGLKLDDHGAFFQLALAWHLMGQHLNSQMHGRY